VRWEKELRTFVAEKLQHLLLRLALEIEKETRRMVRVLHFRGLEEALLQHHSEAFLPPMVVPPMVVPSKHHRQHWYLLAAVASDHS